MALAIKGQRRARLLSVPWLSRLERLNPSNSAFGCVAFASRSTSDAVTVAESQFPKLVKAARALRLTPPATSSSPSDASDGFQVLDGRASTRASTRAGGGCRLVASEGATSPPRETRPVRRVRLPRRASCPSCSMMPTGRPGGSPVWPDETGIAVGARWTPPVNMGPLWTTVGDASSPTRGTPAGVVLERDDPSEDDAPRLNSKARRRGRGLALCWFTCCTSSCCAGSRDVGRSLRHLLAHRILIRETRRFIITTWPATSRTVI